MTFSFPRRRSALALVLVCAISGAGLRAAESNPGLLFYLSGEQGTTWPGKQPLRTRAIPPRRARWSSV